MNMSHNADIEYAVQSSHYQLSLTHMEYGYVLLLQSCFAGVARLKAQADNDPLLLHILCDVDNGFQYFDKYYITNNFIQCKSNYFRNLPYDSPEMWNGLLAYCLNSDKKICKKAAISRAACLVSAIFELP